MESSKCICKSEKTTFFSSISFVSGTVLNSDELPKAETRVPLGLAFRCSLDFTRTPSLLACSKGTCVTSRPEYFAPRENTIIAIGVPSAFKICAL